MSTLLDDGILEDDLFGAGNGWVVTLFGGLVKEVCRSHLLGLPLWESGLL